MEFQTPRESGIPYLHRGPDVFLRFASRDTFEGSTGYLVDVFLEGERVDVLDNLVPVI